MFQSISNMLSPWTKGKVRSDTFVILTYLIEVVVITKINVQKMSVSNEIGIINAKHFVAKIQKNTYFIFNSIIDKINEAMHAWLIKQ